MLSLLIVDDEKLLTESLKEDIDWAKLGIGSVYTAYNSHQAKQMFERASIDLMLCDIEMPQGNGLELLAWVKEHYPLTESVFMTCHAEFKLAQRAMQLGSFDYLLKPVPADELCQVVGKIANKIKKDNEIKQYSRIGQYWSRHQPLLAERFWMDIINHTIPSSLDLIQKEASERSITFDVNLRIVPLLIVIKRYHKTFSPRDEKIIEYALKNSSEELLGLQGNGLLFRLEDRKLLALIPIEQDAPELREALRERGSVLISSVADYFYCDVSIYVGNEVYSHELSEAVRWLTDWDKSNVAVTNKVFIWVDRNYRQELVDFPDMNLWSVMLKEGRGNDVMAQAETFLNSLIGSAHINAEILYRFHHNFLQMVFYVLKLNGIDAHLLFDNHASADLFQHAVRSVTDMIDWMKHTISKSLEYAGTVQQSESFMVRVNAYVTQNLENDGLTREDVASHVFLNPDYLDRLCKKETGCSVTEYIARMRMQLAKELLLKTNMPVGTIAAQVGYSNLAHFSRKFKRFEGTNPNAFRKLLT
ncbi:helix-turn-helix domain-containing protein [Cohnella faecalis]|uniref:Response regulator n=1 Tax=Cohnella faecalis TaxID=2315694 RepID=A0A398CCE9_9BACL|nr:helix-turn-helix domain-containing protein [Cohnella faecalis]RIE00403.1 response regulator [Cohnella faecalis]